MALHPKVQRVIINQRLRIRKSVYLRKLIIMNRLGRVAFKFPKTLRVSNRNNGLLKRSFAEMGHAGDFRSPNQLAPAAPMGSTSLSGVVVGETKSPWQATKDPKGGPGVYYWNTLTNETTPVGVPKPAHWVEVKSDPSAANSQSYWWNPESNSTTQLGAPKPHYSLMTVQPSQQQQQHHHHHQQQVMGGEHHQTFGGMMKTYILLGVGVAVGGMAVRALFGV